MWLFGSAAQRKALTAFSDLDFAVEGLPPLAHFAVLGELMLELRCAVDLIRWEEAGDFMRAQIVQTGTVIYAA